MRSIAITADDYGLHESVNEGIEALAREGLITSVSAMAHEGAVLDTASQLTTLPVDVGAHLVLVEERPLLGAALGPFLDDRGRMPRDYRALFLLVLRHPRHLRLLVAEAEAQLARLADAGIDVAFINSHQHVHMFPPLWRALRPLLARARAVRAVRMPARAPAKQALLDVAGLASWAAMPVAARVLRPVGVDLAGKLEHADLAALERRLRATARFTRDQLELVVHPGASDRALTARYPHWGYHWEGESRVLRSPAFARMLAGAGLTLARSSSSSI